MEKAVELLRTGFIGAGVMASWAVYTALHFTPIHLQAVCDLDEGRDLTRFPGGEVRKLSLFERT